METMSEEVKNAWRQNSTTRFHDVVLNEVLVDNLAFIFLHY
jgi:hypothetical protein